MEDNPMISRICDRCGQPLEDGALRFTAKIHLFAAYDPLDITFEDMTRDHEQEIRKIAAECKGMTEEELMEEGVLACRKIIRNREQRTANR